MGSILGLIQDHKGIVERSTPHKGHRGDLNCPVFYKVNELFVRDHVAQCIIQRLHVRIQLFLQVAGQEPQVFTGFHRGPG